MATLCPLPADGETLLQLAVRTKQPELVDAFAKASCQIGFVHDKDNMTALHVALGQESKEACVKLINMVVEQNVSTVPTSLRTIMEILPLLGEMFPDILIHLVLPNIVCPVVWFNLVLPTRSIALCLSLRTSFCSTTDQHTCPPPKT